MLPKLVIEKDNVRNSLIIIGLLMIVGFVLMNIVLRSSINQYYNNKEAVKQNTNLSLEKSFAQRIKLQTKCPEESSGNPEAFLTIKYFYSPVCFWCVLEDKNLDELLEKEGQAFKLEKYSRENCAGLMQKYEISLAPSFVFSTQKDQKEYTVDGYVSKEDLAKIICDVTGFCLVPTTISPIKNQFKGQKVKIKFK